MELAPPLQKNDACSVINNVADIPYGRNRQEAIGMSNEEKKAMTTSIKYNEMLNCHYYVNVPDMRIVNFDLLSDALNNVWIDIM